LHSCNLIQRFTTALLLIRIYTLLRHSFSNHPISAHLLLNTYIHIVTVKIRISNVYIRFTKLTEYIIKHVSLLHCLGLTVASHRRELFWCESLRDLMFALHSHMLNLLVSPIDTDCLGDNSTRFHCNNLHVYMTYFSYEIIECYMFLLFTSRF